MKLRRNAKTPHASRLGKVTRGRAGWTYADIADCLGASVRTVESGYGGTACTGHRASRTPSSRPGPPSHQTAADFVQLIRLLREDCHGSAWQSSGRCGCRARP